MDAPRWFDDLPVLGAMPPAQAAAKLREIGEFEVAAEIETAQTGAVAFSKGARPWFLAAKPWQHTAHAYGYLAPAPPGDTLLPIRHAGNVEADATLKDARLRITLDRLRVADYPGGSTHHVLFDFYGENQVEANQVEQLHFNATFRAREGEQAAVVGYPIFVGLNVSQDGVAFKGFTVNVQNEDDEAFLGVLESDQMRSGLKLMKTAQPAIGPLADIAYGLARSLATRNRNVRVQNFYLGLDFTQIATGARLREGSYLVIQVPEQLEVVWNWNDWGYNPANGHVVNRENNSMLIPYNYIVFGVSRYEG
jgi:hypothetical protein